MLVERGILERLVEEMKQGLSHPHLKSICRIEDSMMGSLEFCQQPLEPGILPACISILKEEVEQSEPTSLIFPVLSSILTNRIIHNPLQDFFEMEGLKWYCKQMTKGDKSCVEKGMQSLQRLAMSKDSEILQAWQTKVN